MEELYKQIKEAHEKRGFKKLFEFVLNASKKIKEKILKLWERVVIEKRISWLNENLERLRTGNPIEDALNIFYKTYLGISPEKDGEILEKSERKLVTRWWNKYPILENCEKFGLDTRETCKKVYEKPAQIFLSKINPNLKFRRHYELIRPHAPFCEEIITYEE